MKNVMVTLPHRSKVAKRFQHVEWIVPAANLKMFGPLVLSPAPQQVAVLENRAANECALRLNLVAKHAIKSMRSDSTSL